MPRFLVVLAVGVIVIATGSVERGVVADGNPRGVVDEICVLIAEHVDRFTRVEAPPELHDGRFRPDAVNIEVTYTGFTAQAQAAFQHAVNIWKTQLTSGVTVTVNAQFAALGAGVLGSAGFNRIHRDFTNAPQPSTWFPGPIANARAGSEISAAPQITAQFSNSFNWYYGTDGNTPAGQFDFVSVVLHELGHGLGFVGSPEVSGTVGVWGITGFPFIYDHYLVNGASQSLINTAIFQNSSAALAAQLTSNNVFWSGSSGVAANGGVRPKLYAPLTWNDGSSISHLDDATFPAGNANSLMTHAIGSAEAIHNPGPITRGIFADSGWTLDSGTPSCTYTLSGTSFTIGQPGGIGTVGVTTSPGCAWTATSNSPFITITANANTSGTKVVSYSVLANSGGMRTGTMTIAGQTYTLTQLGVGPLLTVNRASLAFGAVNTGALSNITASQPVTLTFASGSPSWSATTSTPWLQITGGNGSGNGQFTVSVINVSGLPTSGTVTGSITVASTGAANTPITINVRLTLFPSTATSAVPFGSFDTPVTGSNVSGSIPVTGWALDDIEVSRVEIWRDRVAGETTPVYPGSGPGNGKIYIADASFVSGARPDVETGYPTMPLAHRAGWGYLLLTYGLWNQGNGSYQLYAFAFDKEGRSATLGTKTITSNNAAATKPFGSIDTPAFGQTVSGTLINFGWALTPNATPACTITNGNVFVSFDSGPLQAVNYGVPRSDIAGAFPSYSNAAAASGNYVIETSTLTNGTHQIGWYVVDSCGRAEGVGSRFFNVLNGASLAPTSDAAARPAARATAVSREPVIVRRGDAAETVWADPLGDHVVPLGQSDRVEVQLPGSALPYAAYQIVNGERRALPLGSSFDAAQGTFYWQPAAGFFGAYDLAFVSASAGELRAKVVVSTAVQAAIDLPQPGPVASQFVVAGWAIDQGASSGTGIATVHVWAYPAQGGAPIFLGVAAYGDARPDIGALFGDRFTGAAYGLVVNGTLPRGDYRIVVFPYSTVTGDFRGAKTVRVTVQ